MTEVMGRRKGRRYLSAVAEYWSARRATVRWQGDHSVEIRPFGDHYRLHLNYIPPPGGGQIGVMGGFDDCIWPEGTPPAQ